jgi:hypothetical protein
MKARELKPLFRNYLAHKLEGFTLRGRMLYKEPIEYLLRGFSFEPSGFDSGGFYLQVFVQPLYIPFEAVGFFEGQRLGGGAQYWHVRDNESAVMGEVTTLMREVGLPFLESVRSPGALARWLEKKPITPMRMEGLAYSLILAGRPQRAKTVLAELQPRLEQIHADESRRGRTIREWEIQFLGRVRTMRGLLERDPTGAVKQLSEWRNYTVHHLGLDDVATAIDEWPVGPF